MFTTISAQELIRVQAALLLAFTTRSRLVDVSVRAADPET